MHSSSMRCHRHACRRSAFRTERPRSLIATPCRAQAPRQQDQQQSAIAQIASSLAAAAVLLSVEPAHAEAIYAAGPSQYAYPAAERYAEQEEARFDEWLMTKELRDLLALLQKGNYSLSDLEAARLKVGFRRELDGRVSLKGQDGHWYWIKNDMQSPGFILVCDQQDGRVLFLPPDESGRLMQIDLSDDAVVGQLFGSGAWQDVMEQLQVETMQGKLVPLVMSGAEFRNTGSLLEDALEQEVEQ